MLSVSLRLLIRSNAQYPREAHTPIRQIVFHFHIYSNLTDKLATYLPQFEQIGSTYATMRLTMVLDGRVVRVPTDMAIDMDIEDSDADSGSSKDGTSIVSDRDATHEIILLRSVRKFIECGQKFRSKLEQAGVRGACQKVAICSGLRGKQGLRSGGLPSSTFTIGSTSARIFLSRGYLMSGSSGTKAASSFKLYTCVTLTHRR
jgi:hypothetical protein